MCGRDQCSIDISSDRGYPLAGMLTTLAHESGGAYGSVRGIVHESAGGAIKWENIARIIFGCPQRESHGAAPANCNVLALLLASCLYAGCVSRGAQPEPRYDAATLGHVVLGQEAIEAGWTYFGRCRESDVVGLVPVVCVKLWTFGWGSLELSGVTG